MVNALASHQARCLQPLWLRQTMRTLVICSPSPPQEHFLNSSLPSCLAPGSTQRLVVTWLVRHLLHPTIPMSTGWPPMLRQTLTQSGGGYVIDSTHEPRPTSVLKRKHVYTKFS